MLPSEPVTWVTCSSSGVPGAIASGAIQLAVGLLRKRQTGQRPMIISGALSVVAGTFFVVSAADATSLSSIAGYAVVGGVFVLVSTLRLRRH